jgi:hypothetical protein
MGENNGAGTAEDSVTAEETLSEDEMLLTVCLRNRGTGSRLLSA